MFAQLPESVRKEVLLYLQTDFQKAKAIHDAWLEKQITDLPLPQQDRGEVN